MIQRLRTAIVGLGGWGRNVARELAAASDLVAYASREPAKHGQWMAEHAPGVRALTVEQIAADPTIAAVAVAVPIPALAELAARMIAAGKHVLVEKPAAQASAEARGLAEAAAARNAVVATGYVFVCHAAYRELKRRIAPASVRKVAFRWEKFGSFDDSIELSLFVHHLALALDLLGEPGGGAILRGPGLKSACDRIEARLAYPQAEVVSLIDRASAQRAHTMTIEQADGTSFVWDGDAVFVQRDGARQEVFRTPPHSALASEVREFVAAAQGAAMLPTAGYFAARVLGVLERLERR